MHCLETNEFPYYPTDDVWRREEFSKFIQYQGNLWDNKIIKQTMHGLALSWSYMPHAFDVKCGNMNTPLQTFLCKNSYYATIHHCKQVCNHL